MVMNRPFTTVGQAIASFDSVDLLNGVGFETFFAGAQVITSAVINYTLSNVKFHCSRTGEGVLQNQVYSKVASDENVFTKKLDLDFDRAE